MQLVERTFQDFSTVKVSFWTARLESRPWQKHEQLLLIGFGSDSLVNHSDLSFMRAMQLAGAQIWWPSAIVLDLRELRYQHGDMMSALFCYPYRQPVTQVEKLVFDQEGDSFPIVAVVSQHNREALTSLVKLEMSGDPAKILFDSFEHAVAAIEAEIARADMRKAP